MKLWISAEIDADVVDKHTKARKLVENLINKKTTKHKFEGKWKSWDYISIIMSEGDSYKETCKKHSKDRSLEFRLKIDHGKFKKADQKKANLMLLHSLAEGVGKMEAMDVPMADINFLKEIMIELMEEV